jgi:hypothetical protein
VVSFGFLGDPVPFCFGILGGGDRELCFFLHKIRGEFVVNTWFLCGFLLVGNDADRPGVNVRGGAVWSDRSFRKPDFTRSWHRRRRRAENVLWVFTMENALKQIY